MKGTGRWTVQEAAEQSVAAPTIAAALDSRYLSARKDERLKASKILKGPTEMPSVSKEQVRVLIFSAIFLDEIVFVVVLFIDFGFFLLGILRSSKISRLLFMLQKLFLMPKVLASSEQHQKKMVGT